jgi:LacI family transcriptional regulator
MDTGEAAGYNITIHRMDTQDARQVAGIVGMAAQHEVDALVITPPCDNSPQLLASLTEINFPFILIAPQKHSIRCASVAPTDERGSYEAAWHLIRLGHTRIGYIQGQPDHQASIERLRGYERALKEAGIPIKPDLIRPGDWEFETGLEQARELLTLADRPTAIMAPNDVVATGVLQAAWERGLNCPRQISVVGFDDIPLARQVCPPLTTVHQPIYELATTAMSLLMEQLTSGNARRDQVELATELVIRHSTGPAPSQ